MPALGTREEELVSRQGVDWTVAVYADKVVAKSRSRSGILRRAISTVTTPQRSAASAATASRVISVCRLAKAIPPRLEW